jgi:NitT/TauT family transport system permease protein
MDNYDKELEQKVPDFEGADDSKISETSSLNIAAAASTTQIKGWKQTVGIIAVAIFVIGLWELLVRVLNVPEFILPPPSKIVVALVTSFPNIYQHLLFTLGELVSGYLIGASIGLLMAAVLTQIPFIEKIITPYILILVTTPTIALVPLLMLYWGFGIGPRIFAVALATGPMVMINATTGFRRTDLAKIALAKSYGASTFQIFYKIRFPLAMPMINVGLLVGGIFGLITAVGADMVGGKIGLGNRLSYYASLARMSNFFAVILLVSIIGILIWVIMTIVGNKTTNWSE